MPSRLDPSEQAAWEFSRRLAGSRGPLDSATWQKARDCLGLDGGADLTHVIGAYAYLCLFQNAADIPLPHEERL